MRRDHHRATKEFAGRRRRTSVPWPVLIAPKRGRSDQSNGNNFNEDSMGFGNVTNLITHELARDKPTNGNGPRQKYFKRSDL